MRKPYFLLAALALTASGAFGSLATVNGADHKDSPSVANDLTGDNTDIFAFRKGDNLVVVTGFNPLTMAGDNSRTNFDPNVQFQIEVDRTGDNNPDATANVRFSSNTVAIEGLGAPINAPITPPGESNPIVTEAGGVKVFAGLRDDPFFFDLNGFMAFVSNPQAPASGLRAAGGGSPSDTFASTNVTALVLEVPIMALTGGNNPNSGTIKVVGNVNRGNNAVDRVAIPAVNTALVPPDQKNAFNQARDENQDSATFGPGVLSSIQTLRGAVDGLFGPSMPQDGGPLGNLSAEQVRDALLPYIVTIDFSKPVQFPNGRQLEDDVIDAALGLVLNRGGASGVSDGVNGNDRPFLASFPYLAPPHSMTPARTGDAGLLADDRVMGDSTTLWSLSAGLLALAAVLAGAGVFGVLRSRGG